MTPELDLVTDAAFLVDLDSREMGELRALRSRCQSLENSLSYVRRLIQGRLDIAGGEAQRRIEGGEGGDTPQLIGLLPDILSEGSRVHGGPGAVRPPQSMEPDPDVTQKLEARLDAAVDPEDLARATQLTDGELRAAIGSLHSLEDEVSDTRRRVHDVIDTIQAEVTRRYRTGEASVEGLLQG